MSQLAQYTSTPLVGPMPSTYLGMRALFSGLLAHVGMRNGVQLLFDGLNTLSDEHSARELSWLPSPLPEGVRVLVSTTDEDTWGAMRNRYPDDSHTQLELEALGPQDAASVACHVLQATHKQQLDTRQTELLLAKEDGRLPLYTRLCCMVLGAGPSLALELLPGTLGDLYDYIVGQLAREATIAASIALLITLPKSEPRHCSSQQQLFI